MICETVRKGMECFFMTKKGCKFNGGSCHPVVDQCNGCERIIELPSGKYCSVFPDPASKWRLGPCNMATHLKEDSKNEGNGKKINPLKASKRRIR